MDGLNSTSLTSNNYVQTQLGTKLNSSSYTASDVLTKIKTVDGSGSGLDADTLDGLNSTSLASNNYIQDRLDTKATNTYVNSTFTSNNYIDGRFTSNNFVKAVFTSNNYVDNQLNTRIGIRATNTYVQSTFTSNSFAVDTFSSNAYMRDHVATEVAAIVNSAPAALDTLNELAAALGDDPNFATTVSNQIGIRATNTYVNSTFTSNSYVDDQLNARIGIRATNTYVNSTFTSNNYVDGRFASNNYVKAVFSSNNYNQATYGSNNYNAATYPSISGTPANDRIAVWTGASTLEGDTSLKWDGSQLLLNASTTESRNIEVGKNRTGNGYAFIDFIGDATYTDYGLRMLRGNGGPNTDSTISHRGTGSLIITANDAGNIELHTSSSPRAIVAANGNVGIGTTSPSKELEVNGTITDDVSDVRTPRQSNLTGASDHNLTNEGVYMVDAASTFSQIIIGTGATLTAGTIMTIYNNRSTSVTISRGSIPNMRNAADGDYTNYATLTLGRNSVTTVTMFNNALIVLTGTSIT